MANALMKQQIPITRLLLFIAILIVFMFIGGIITTIGVMTYYNIPFTELSSFISDYSNQDNITGLGIINAGTQVFGFLLASILFMYIFGKASVNGFWLKLTGILILLSPIVMILANPIIGLSMELNNFLIPEGSWLETIFKPMEEKAAEATEAFLHMPDTGKRFRNLILIALIPAVCEEFVFRGVLQSQFAKWTKNVHYGVWISAFFFSAIHMQFYGFIPRMLMGGLLGYLLVWSGSIWAPIIAHFTNNGLAVLASYYVQHQPGLTDEIFEEQTSTLPVVIVGLILFGLSLWLFWKNSKWNLIKKEYLFEESDYPPKY